MSATAKTAKPSAINSHVRPGFQPVTVIVPMTNATIARSPSG